MREQKAIIVLDLGFGDTGKGTIVDYLTRKQEAHTVIRYNGGSQAGHNVVTPDGRHHTFSQFCSGTFVEGVRTHISRFMLVDPLSMMKEEDHLRYLGITDALTRTTIDGEAPVITPFHQASNRLKQILNTRNRYGSTGRGVSEAMADYLRFNNETLIMADLKDEVRTKRKLNFLRDIQQEKVKDFREYLPESETTVAELRILDEPDVVSYTLELYNYFATQAKIVDRDYLKGILNQPGTVIFEGAQGVLLDEKHGFYPYITRGNATAENAEALLLENDYSGKTTKLGLLRAYATRHGAGPFPTEDTLLSEQFPDANNLTNPWQGRFRVGYFDNVLAKYSLNVLGGIDYLALTHLDILVKFPSWRVCDSYQFSGIDSDFENYFEVTSGVVRRIKVYSPNLLENQERLTQLVEQCTPIYEEITPVNSDVSNYVSYLQNRLCLPIPILSYGPTARDKVGSI